MVTSAIPKHLYESKPEVFYEAMDVLSQELQDLLLVGVFDPVTKQHYKACVIGTKGDWPYLAKVAKFTRTFQSGAKKGRKDMGMENQLVESATYVLPAKTSFPMKKSLPNCQDG